MAMQSVVQSRIPGSLFSGIRGFLSRFSNEMTMVIDKYTAINPNEFFEAARAFLPTEQLPSMRRVQVAKPTKEDDLTLAMGRNQVLVDTFGGIKLKWVFASRRVYSGNRGLNSPGSHEVQYFELTFHKKHEELARKSYLPFRHQRGRVHEPGEEDFEAIHSDLRPRLWRFCSQFLLQKTEFCIFITIYLPLHRPRSDWWTLVSLDYPATFETVAMDLELKKKLIDDLERFVTGKEHYRRAGKVWKRGYLLSGPPGTGKIEPGCGDGQSLEIRRVILSGFLNFIERLQSSCGDHRIIVFSTNHKRRLDPALLRPGHMDLHIPVSYCTPCGFRVLAFNHLRVDHHELFDRIESLLKTARVTLAEVAE
ncbi:hypothetical protein NL676_006323 [Syzygium grande]|nr:hypothetical protein NL676_006323 [Syzygium grande]